MSNKKKNIRGQVEQRRKAEAEAQAAKLSKAKPATIEKLAISDDELQGYINENRVGDAKLYCRLHR